MKNLFALIRRKLITKMLMKEAMQELGKQIVKDGNALETLVKLKVIEDCTGALKAEILDAALKEAKAMDDKVAIQGISYYINTSAKKYDYSKDEGWVKLNDKLNKIKEQMKKKEKSLLDKGLATVKSGGNEFIAFTIN